MVEIRSEAKFGYYVEDDGTAIYYYFMGKEPPEGQYIYKLLNGAWRPLKNGYFLMDMIMDGNPNLTGPTSAPPEGIPPAPGDGETIVAGGSPEL
jgi:hypothetical protein